MARGGVAALVYKAGNGSRRARVRHVRHTEINAYSMRPGAQDGDPHDSGGWRCLVYDGNCREQAPAVLARYRPSVQLAGAVRWFV